MSAAGRRGTPATDVRVAGDDNAAVGFCSGEQFVVRCSAIAHLGPYTVVAELAQPANDRPGHDFVGEETQAPVRARSGFDGVDPLRLNGFLGYAMHARMSSGVRWAYCSMIRSRV